MKKIMILMAVVGIVTIATINVELNERANALSLDLKKSKALTLMYSRRDCVGPDDVERSSRSPYDVQLCPIVGSFCNSSDKLRGYIKAGVTPNGCFEE